MIHGDYAAIGGVGLTWLEVCQRQAKGIPKVGLVHPVSSHRYVTGLQVIGSLASGVYSSSSSSFEMPR